MITSAQIGRLTTHELCQLVAAASAELSRRIAPPEQGLDLVPGARLAAQMGRTGSKRGPEEELRAAIAGMSAEQRNKLAQMKAERQRIDQELVEEINKAFRAAGASLREAAKQAQADARPVVSVTHQKIQTLLCQSCEKTWSRPAKRGRPPKTCPECAK